MKPNEAQSRVPLPSEIPARVTTPPPVPLAKIYPAGTHVLATLANGNKVNGVVKGFDEATKRFKIVWEKSPGVPAIAYIPISHIKNLKAVDETAEFLRHKIGEVVSPSTEVDNAIADIMDSFYKEQGKIATTEILNGEKSGTLKDGIVSSDTASGYHVAAATDKGHKQSNQDRVVVSPRANMIAVVDGMGGTGDGEKAAEVVAMELVKNPVDIKTAAKNAMMRINQHNLGMSGACFLAANVWEDEKGKKLDYCQAGDVGLIIIGKNGKIKYKSTDQSFSNVLVKYKNITEDESYYLSKSQRETATNSISTQEYFNYIRQTLEQDSKKLDIPNKEKIIEDVKSVMGKIYSETVDVKSGDRVVIFSDGISDNFTPEEIASLIAGQTPEKAIETLSDETDLRILDAQNIEKTTGGEEGRKKAGKYSDGHLTKPKKDNRAITIMDIA